MILKFRNSGLKVLAAIVAVMGLWLVSTISSSAKNNAVTWDWQLSGTPDLTRKVDVLNLDPGDVNKKDMAALKARGIKTICYVSVGTFENYRDDVEKFPKSVLGVVNEDWPDEQFLDIRQLNALLPIMQARFKFCAEKGFDAVEADNIDLHDNDTGFDIEESDTVRYIKVLARLAHELGLEIGQKNTAELVPQLLEFMDFAIVESCYLKGRCELYQPYVDAGKMVLNVEYTDTGVNYAKACTVMKDSGISMVFKDRELTTQFQNCDAFGIVAPIKIKPKLLIIGE